MKRTDKQRLDWIQKHRAEVECDGSDPREMWIIEPSDYEGGYEWKSTLRKAIDAAMDKETKHGR